MTNPPRETRLAVLIDAENVSVRLVRQVLSRLESSRVLTVKRAYGDWGRLQAAWKATLIDCGIQAIHAPNYATGKNSADMVLTIDAMDLLHQQVNWFCLVSHDSDFTPLAHRLVGAGAKVVGFGSRRASQAFINACHRFVLLEEPAKPEPSPALTHPEAPALSTPAPQAAVGQHNSPLETQPAKIQAEPIGQPTVPQIAPKVEAAKQQQAKQQAKQQQAKQQQAKQQTSKKQTAAQINSTPPTGQKTPKVANTQTLPAQLTQAKLGETLQLLFCSASSNNSWLNLNSLHSLIQKQYPNFSCKRLGYSGLVKLVEGVERFEIRQRQPNAQQPNKKVTEIRLKQAA